MSSKGIVNTILGAIFTVIFLCAGCVERKLTIITEPPGALVVLNDEEIGTSPVTVGFEWYGDYSVRISKDGYKTLDTHQKLKRPVKDYFPFDLLADIFTTKIDEYTWTFTLEPYQQIEKDELIKSAINLQKQAIVDPNADASKVKKVKGSKSKPKA